MAQYASLAEAQEKANPDRPIFAWNDLVEIVGMNGLHILGRHRAEEVRYQEWAEKVKAEYGSGGMERYILTERLRWSEQDLRDGMEEKDFGSFQSTMGPNLVQILKNDWPYSLTKDVEHWVVWTRVPFMLDVQEFKEYVAEGISGFIFQSQSDADGGQKDGLAQKIRRYVLIHWDPDKYETCYFLNPPRLQSVKGLGHFHVFSRSI